MVRIRLSCAVGLLVLGVTTACQDAEPAKHPLEMNDTSSASSTTSQTHPPDASQEATSIDDPRVAQSSGLARSYLHPGVLYTHNDRSTSAPQIFAIDASGTRAVLTLEAPAVDWEDIASTPDGRVWVADTGDNDGARSSIAVYVVTEPSVLTSSTLATTTYRFTYPDGSHNAEALLVHPTTHRLYLVTKDPVGGTVFVAPSELDPEGVNVLEPLAEAPANVTAGDFSPDGSMLVLRTQGRAYFYRGFEGQPVGVTLPKQPQGEAITFEADGAHVLLGSEGPQSQILRLTVPTLPS
ncbi:hypothetical protein [Nocardioides sp. Root140]|nr:hypothetical protein [Nocardioides sp. Root140]KQY55564.1 hypothetical protein ASD30_16885 [Nocardioides sp. Root140]KQZ67222.1 hypothetical protein ASD66_19815 [Nocardioides sp. Root151]